MRWLLIDKFAECEPGVRAVGVKCFSRSDIVFMDHFPGFPIVPGVLQIEMIAQTGGKCIRMAHPEVLPALGGVKSAKFIRSIEPGDQCFIKVEITQLRKAYALATGHIEVNGQKVSEAEVMFAMVPSSNLDQTHEDPVMADWRKRKEGKAHE